MAIKCRAFCTHLRGKILYLIRLRKRVAAQCSLEAGHASGEIRLGPCCLRAVPRKERVPRLARRSTPMQYALIDVAFEGCGQETPCQRIPLHAFGTKPRSHAFLVLGIQVPNGNVCGSDMKAPKKPSFCVNVSVSCLGVEIRFLPTKRRPNCMLKSDMSRGRQAKTTT